MKLILPILTIASAPLAHSAIVAQFDFASIIDVNETSSTFLSSSVDAETNSLASDITSPSTDYTSTAHTATRVNPEFGDIYNNGGDQAVSWTARANNPVQDFGVFLPIDTYFSFNVAAESGATIDFSSLSLLTGVYRTISGTTANDYTLSYSTDGTNFVLGTTILAGTNAGEAATIAVNGVATATITFDLSGITALQGITGTAYFQIDPVAAAGSSQNGSGSQRGGFIDDVVVNATVTIPEPTVALLGSIGLLGLLRRRRL
jgi:hypothetical protein